MSHQKEQSSALYKGMYNERSIKITRITRRESLERSNDTSNLTTNKKECWFRLNKLSKNRTLKIESQRSNTLTGDRPDGDRISIMEGMLRAQPGNLVLVRDNGSESVIVFIRREIRRNGSY